MPFYDWVGKLLGVDFRLNIIDDINRTVNGWLGTAGDLCWIGLGIAVVALILYILSLLGGRR